MSADLELPDLVVVQEAVKERERQNAEAKGAADLERAESPRAAIDADSIRLAHEAAILRRNAARKWVHDQVRELRKDEMRCEGCRSPIPSVRFAPGTTIRLHFGHVVAVGCSPECAERAAS